MNKKKLIGIIVGVVVVVGAVAGGVVYHKANTKPSNSFGNLVNQPYTVNTVATKVDGGFDYTLNVEGAKLTPQVIQNIAGQAQAVATKPVEITVNEFKAGTLKANEKFAGYYNNDIETKAIVGKSDEGKLIQFKPAIKVQFKSKENKSNLGEFSNNGSTNIDGVEALRVTVANSKDLDVDAATYMNLVKTENPNNKKVDKMVVDFANSNNKNGVILDNSNSNIQGEYTIFNVNK